MLGNTVFEDAVSFLLQDTETRKIGWWPVLLIECGKIEAFMASECFICDDLTHIHEL